LKVKKWIGFDVTETHRTFADGKLEIANQPGLPRYSDRYEVEYPLREWGLDREACGKLIVDQGLPLPPKSACFFCPAMSKIEIAQLAKDEPELYWLALAMEATYRGGKHFRGDDAWTVKAKHKVTKEKLEWPETGPDRETVRTKARTKLKDASPFQWELDLYQAVPGLGRQFAWSHVA
jgi:hypothetical protein